MKDSIALLVGTLGAGTAETVQLISDATPPSSDETLIGGAITVITGLISMLLSRLLNKWFKKKQNPSM